MRTERRFVVKVISFLSLIKICLHAFRLLTRRCLMSCSEPQFAMFYMSILYCHDSSVSCSSLIVAVSDQRSHFFP